MAPWEVWEPSRGRQAGPAPHPQLRPGPAQAYSRPFPEWVGGRPRFYFRASVPQMPLLAQRLVAGRGDFGEEALSTSSHL